MVGSSGCYGEWSSAPRDWTTAAVYRHSAHMTHRRRRSMGCARAMRGRWLGLGRWVVALYLLSLGVPGLGAAHARAAKTGSAVVELCTSSGFTHVVLDANSWPVEQAPSGSHDHATHECSGCPATCGNHDFWPQPGVLLVLSAPRPRQLRRPLTDLRLALAPATRAPLPPRGPPQLS